MRTVVEFLDSLVDEGDLVKGYQLCIRREGEVIMDAFGGVDGRGVRLESKHLFAMYCASKALLAIAVGVLASDDEIDLDDPVGDYIEGCAPHVARLSVAETLSHRSGLTTPSAGDAVVMSRARALRAAATSPLVIPPLQAETSYSVAAESCLLAECLRVTSGQSIEAVVKHRVLDPIGCGRDFSLGDENRELRIVGLALGGVDPVPLLIEATGRLDMAANPGFGGFANARGPAHVFGELARALAGADSALQIEPSVASRLVSPGPVQWDREFQRECSFGLGFMTTLSTHMFGLGWSRMAFAQAGLSGLTTVVADPAIDVSACVQLNGLTDLSVTGDWIRAAAWGKVLAIDLDGGVK